MKQLPQRKIYGTLVYQCTRCGKTFKPLEVDSPDVLGTLEALARGLPETEIIEGITVAPYVVHVCKTEGMREFGLARLVGANETLGDQGNG